MTQNLSTEGTPIRRAAVCSLAASVGLLLIAAGVVIPLAAGGFPSSPLYKWLFTAGAVVCLLAALFNSVRTTDLRERRWQRIESWSAIFFCAASAFLFIPGSAPRDWLAFTLAGAVIRILCFVRGIIADARRRKAK